MTREVSWVPALCGPAEEGEPAVDCESDGDCLASREVPAPLPLPLPPCNGLAREDARRGLPADVTVRDRLPLWTPPA